jgi:hypothetical protein
LIPWNQFLGPLKFKNLGSALAGIPPLEGADPSSCKC